MHPYARYLNHIRGRHSARGGAQTKRRAVALIEYDVAEDNILKGADGFCKKIITHDPGLLIVRIGPNAVFNGYTDAQATEKKILRDVFEEDDAWFNTGDLIKTVDVGYALGKTHYQFVDRIGDTFRWKSENFSTNEVGEILNGFQDDFNTSIIKC